MRHFRAILVAASFLALLVSWPRYSPAQDTAASAVPEGRLSIEGTVTNAEGSPVRNAKVTITSGHIVREAISDKKGEFRIEGLSPGTADIAYEAPGYIPVKERGLLLADDMDLSKTLQEKTADSKWALLLFIPGVVGLLWCTICDGYDNYRRRKQIQRTKGDKEAPPASTDPDSKSGTIPDNHFLTAAVGGVAWSGTLWALVAKGGLGVGGVNSLYLFHWSLPMEVYVPAFGFIGALLFVLDIRRQYGGKESTGNPGEEKPTNSPGGKKPIYYPEEEIPKGKEFGMRIFMGPYVAIVVVALLGEDIGLANFTSPEAKASLAFFSGLLVVAFLQYLVERGQERLGEMRRKSSQNILQRRQKELKEAMGDIVWARLQEAGVNTVSGFAHLDDAALDKVAAGDLPLLKNDLITLRDRARELAIAS